MYSITRISKTSTSLVKNRNEIDTKNKGKKSWCETLDEIMATIKQKSKIEKGSSLPKVAVLWP
jgi:hypothetical protein